VMLASMAHVYYSWLYYGYLVLMFICGLPPLMLIGQDSTTLTPRTRNPTNRSFFVSLMHSYITPATYSGGFPIACLCTFLFSLGSAPMFFIMLMLKDLVGMNDQVQLQRHFSYVSIDFFLCAALATVAGAALAPEKREEDSEFRETAAGLRPHSFFMTTMSVILFAIIILFIPIVAVFKDQTARASCFYVLAGLMGGTFGSVYSRFQDCTWQLLPQNAEVANAMGFATMCKLVGAGLGNFVIGLILSFFAKPEEKGMEGTSELESYRTMGYVVMSLVSAACVLSSGGFLCLLLRSDTMSCDKLQGKAASSEKRSAEPEGEPVS